MTTIDSPIPRTTPEPSALGALRPATEADVPAIRALVRAAYAKWVPVIGREPVPMSADYAQAVRLHRFDLLERDGGLVALVETIPRADHLWIENLAVSPAHHGQGLGRAMLRRAEAAARELGHTTIKLGTNQAFAATSRSTFGRIRRRARGAVPGRDRTVLHQDALNEVRPGVRPGLSARYPTPVGPSSVSRTRRASSIRR